MVVNKLTFVFICGLLLNKINMKVISLKNIDFMSNGVVRLIVDESPVNSSDREDVMEHKSSKPSDDKNISEDFGEHVRVIADGDITEERNANIDNELKDEINKKYTANQYNTQPDNSTLIKIKVLLKNIKKMLKKDDKKLSNDNFISYVPISEDMENPKTIQGMVRSNVLKSGLNIVNYEGKKYLDIF